MGCGKNSVSRSHHERLTILGEALHAQQNLFVFDRGFVGFCDEDESEVIRDVARKRRRSASEQWSGWRTAQRPQGPTGEARNFRSEALQEAFGTEFRVLAQHYAALAFEDELGLWVVASSEPLGAHGPRIEFLVAVPLDRRLMPKAWAFQRFGKRLKPMSLKHTNFPDASICAFIPGDDTWSPNDGILALMDIYSVWAVKKLHRDQVGYWPGKQYGASALYRRLEFKPNELCGCSSGEAYKNCHQGVDNLITEEAALNEFRRLFNCDYEARSFPRELIDSAASNWNHIPVMQRICNFTSFPI